jgi:hypothetical protein
VKGHVNTGAGGGQQSLSPMSQPQNAKNCFLARGFLVGRLRDQQAPGNFVYLPMFTLPGRTTAL